MKYHDRINRHVEKIDMLHLPCDDRMARQRPSKVVGFRSRMVEQTSPALNNDQEGAMMDRWRATLVKSNE